MACLQMHLRPKLPCHQPGWWYCCCCCCDDHLIDTRDGKCWFHPMTDSTCPMSTFLLPMFPSSVSPPRPRPPNAHVLVEANLICPKPPLNIPKLLLPRALPQTSRAKTNSKFCCVFAPGLHPSYANQTILHLFALSKLVKIAVDKPQDYGLCCDWSPSAVWSQHRSSTCPRWLLSRPAAPSSAACRHPVTPRTPGVARSKSHDPRALPSSQDSWPPVALQR
mmetsp:Transcript_7177/g.15666  ORF Transcript_7177/g.15666 Transcript_7177/m.15666 type:complete len:221 (+) Transcript_7177:499-1161(+)